MGWINPATGLAEPEKRPLFDNGNLRVARSVLLRQRLLTVSRSEVVAMAVIRWDGDRHSRRKPAATVQCRDEGHQAATFNWCGADFGRMAAPAFNAG
jgi:hypothetical protein